MGTGTPYSFVRGSPAGAGAGTPVWFVRSAIALPGSGGAYSFERGSEVGPPRSGSTFRHVRSQVLPVAPRGGGTYHAIRSAVSQSRGSSTFRHPRTVLTAPWLALRYRNGTLGVYRWDRQYLYEQVGNSFGSVEENGIPYDRVYGNRVIQFGTDLIAFMNNDVRKYNPGTDNWDIQQTLTLDAEQRTGIHRIKTVIGTELILLARDATSDQSVAYTSTDGSTWTQRALGTSMIGIKTGRAYVYRNRVFWPTSVVGGEVLEYNRTDDAWTAHALPSANASQGRDFAFAVIDNRLMLLAWSINVASSPAQLYELVGNSFVLIQTIGASFGASDVITSAPANANNSGERSASALFVDNGNLYAIWFGSSDSLTSFGSFVSKLVPTGGVGTTFTETNLTSTVMPTGLRSASNGGSATGRHVWTVMVDTFTESPAPKIIFSFTDDMSGGDTTLYIWNGETLGLGRASDLDIEAEGFAQPSVIEGGGDRYWTESELNVEIVDIIPKVGGVEEIQFRAFGSPGSTSLNVLFYFSPDEETPTTLATLTGTPSVVSGPASAPTLNVGLSRVEGVEPDNVTIYAVDRDQIADGLGSTTNAVIQPVITL